MFGKLMSISDTLMWKYFELLSFRSMDDIAQLQKQVKEGMNPRDTKVSLAREIVARFHSQQAARDALASFEARFRDEIIPAAIDRKAVVEGKSGSGRLDLVGCGRLKTKKSK